MRRFVLDASVTLRWFLDHPVPPYANRIKQHLLRGDRAMVPALWHLEVANAFAVAERRSVLPAADLDQALRELEQIIAHVVDTHTDLVSARQALTTARTFQLSAYDATYLDLAQRQDLPLATLDERLRDAAVRAGVDLAR